jgi:hypothetical protein
MQLNYVRKKHRMADPQKQDEMAALAHWIYSRDEWRRFIRWQKLKKGLLHYLIHFFSFGKKVPTPEVKITMERVWVGGACRQFSSDDHQLKKIDIRSEGKMNVMEITYVWKGSKAPGFSEIRILIPKGKLREAISVQDRLQKN